MADKLLRRPGAALALGLSIVGAFVVLLLCMPRLFPLQWYTSVYTPTGNMVFYSGLGPPGAGDHSEVAKAVRWLPGPDRVYISYYSDGRVMLIRSADHNILVNRMPTSEE